MGLNEFVKGRLGLCSAPEFTGVYDLKGEELIDFTDMLCEVLERNDPSFSGDITEKWHSDYCKEFQRNHPNIPRNPGADYDDDPEWMYAMRRVAARLINMIDFDFSCPDPEYQKVYDKCVTRTRPQEPEDHSSSFFDKYDFWYLNGGADKLSGSSKKLKTCSDSRYADAKVILDGIYKTLRNKLPNCKIERDVGNEPAYESNDFDRELGIRFNEDYAQYEAWILVTLPDGKQSPINVYFSSGIDKVGIAGIEDDYKGIDEYVNVIKSNPSSACYSKTDTLDKFIKSRLSCNSDSERTQFYVLKGKFKDGTDIYYLKNEAGDWTTHIEDALQSNKDSISKYIDAFKSGTRDPEKFEVEVIEYPTKLSTSSKIQIPEAKVIEVLNRYGFTDCNVRSDDEDLLSIECVGVMNEPNQKFIDDLDSIVGESIYWEGVPSYNKNNVTIFEFQKNDDLGTNSNEDPYFKDLVRELVNLDWSYDGAVKLTNEHSQEIDHMYERDKSTEEIASYLNQEYPPSELQSYSNESDNLEDFKVKVNNRLYEFFERRDLSTTAVERLMELYDKDIDQWAKEGLDPIGVSEKILELETYSKTDSQSGSNDEGTDPTLKSFSDDIDLDKLDEIFDQLIEKDESELSPEDKEFFDIFYNAQVSDNNPPSSAYKLYLTEDEKVKVKNYLEANHG